MYLLRKSSLRQANHFGFQVSTIALRLLNGKTGQDLITALLHLLLIDFLVVDRQSQIGCLFAEKTVIG